MALYVLGGQKVKSVSHCSLYTILPDNEIAHRGCLTHTSILTDAGGIGNWDDGVFHWIYIHFDFCGKPRR